MKVIINLLVCLAILVLAQKSQAQPSDWQPATIGLHIASAHAAPGFNNNNPGLYARWGSGPLDGLTLGHIRKNSLGNASTYVAYTARTDRYATRVGTYSAALSAGIISGYYKSAGTYTPGQAVPSGGTLWQPADGGPVQVLKPTLSPLLIPSVAVHITRSAALRLAYLHKSGQYGARAVHLTAEWSF